MCNFHELDDTARRTCHEQLTACADAVGGSNFFLELLEAIRETRPHPLTDKQCIFRAPHGKITWNKVIFQDKLELLRKLRTTESQQGNLLPAPKEKGYKKALNLVRTLKPITFDISPRHREDGEGFRCQPFQIIDDQTTRLDPIFDALFFCSVDTIKQILTYEPTAS